MSDGPYNEKIDKAFNTIMSAASDLTGMANASAYWEEKARAAQRREELNATAVGARENFNDAAEFAQRLQKIKSKEFADTIARGISMWAEVRLRVQIPPEELSSLIQAGTHAV